MGDDESRGGEAVWCRRSDASLSSRCARSSSDTISLRCFCTESSIASFFWFFSSLSHRILSFSSPLVLTPLRPSHFTPKCSGRAIPKKREGKKETGDILNVPGSERRKSVSSQALCSIIFRCSSTFFLLANCQHKEGEIQTTTKAFNIACPSPFPSLSRARI